MKHDDRPPTIAAFAPLDEATLHHLAHVVCLISHSQLFPRFQAARTAVFSQLNSLITSGIPLTTTAFIDLLEQTPGPELQSGQRGRGAAKIPKATIQHWRKRNLLVNMRHGHYTPDSVATILIVSRLAIDHRVGWLPSEIDRRAPRWFCYRKDSPTSRLRICPVPLPKSLPATALLWTTWCGAAWNTTWHSVEHGAARWGGTPTIDELAPWLKKAKTDDPIKLLTILATQQLQAERIAVPDSTTEPWQRTFLSALLHGATVNEAAANAHIPVIRAYTERERNPTFATDWDQARVTAQRSRMGRWSDDPRQRLHRSSPRRLGDWEEPFLTAIQEGATIREAIRRADVALSTLYRTRDEDEAFARAWQRAKEIAQEQRCSSNSTA